MSSMADPTPQRLHDDRIVKRAEEALANFSGGVDAAYWSEPLKLIQKLIAELTAARLAQQEAERQRDQHLERASEEIGKRQSAEIYASRCEDRELAVHRKLEAAESRLTEAHLRIEELEEKLYGRHE